MEKIFDLTRFITAQQRDYSLAFEEMKNGHKISHWIWYIFPQLKGLGSSFNSDYYGIENIDEAEAFLANDYLRNNLIEISKLLLLHQDKSVEEIMGGYPDDIKLRSCMTLFSMTENSDPVFSEVLNTFFDGQADKQTLFLIELRKDI